MYFFAGTFLKKGSRTLQKLSQKFLFGYVFKIGMLSRESPRSLYRFSKFGTDPFDVRAVKCLLYKRLKV